MLLCTQPDGCGDGLGKCGVITVFLGEYVLVGGMVLEEGHLLATRCLLLHRLWVVAIATATLVGELAGSFRGIIGQELLKNLTLLLIRDKTNEFLAHVGARSCLEVVVLLALVDPILIPCTLRIAVHVRLHICLESLQVLRRAHLTPS